MPAQIRPFARDDRAQLTALVNAHVAAVMPNLSVSTQHLLSTLEREPGELIVDPWVRERRTLVAIQRDCVVAAAHLLRFRDDDDVNESLRGAGEIRWLVFAPDADSSAAAEQLLAACLAVLEAWQVRAQLADGTLPAPGVYGLPDAWPHVRALLASVGFVDVHQVEVVLVADVDTLAAGPDLDHLTSRRTLGVCGTRLTAYAGDDPVCYVEVDTNLDAAERSGRFDGWADVGNLEVPDDQVARWLLARAAHWLGIGGVRRLLAYGYEDEVPRLVGLGFEPLTRTERLAARRT